MTTLVVGGIGKHRFLLIDGYQLITPAVNRSFETGIGDWEAKAAGCAIQYQDNDTFFGDYCMKIEDDNAVGEEYVTYRYDLPSGDLGDRKYALYFWARSDSICTGNIQMETNSTPPDDAVGNEDIGLTTLWKPYIVVFTNAAGADGDVVWVHFKPYANAAGAGGTGIMYIDNVHMYEISWDYALDPATRFRQKWDEIARVKYPMLAGTDKVYPEGSIYKAELYWDYLEPPEELVKSKIYAARQLLFMPHIDYNWAVLCRRDGSHERDYFHNRYIGHEGFIRLSGLELLETDPPEIPAGAGGGEALGSGTLTLSDVVIT